MSVIKKDNININNNNLEWSKLNYVQIHFIEMERQCQRIKDVGSEFINKINILNAAVEELASLVDSTVDIGELTNIPYQINQKSSIVTEAMDSQIVSYSNLNEDVRNKILGLSNLLSQLFDSDKHLITYYIDGVEYQEIYQNVLERYLDEEKKATEKGRADARLDILTELTGKNLKSYTEYYGEFVDNLYSWIENNLSQEMKEIGAKNGEEYINKLLLDATVNCTSNREKTVTSSVALNKFLYDNNIKLEYKYGGAHGSEYSLADISNCSDCSSYVSTLIKIGNPDFIPGTTRTLANNSEYIGNNYLDLSPGDILMHDPYGGGAHVMLLLGTDENGNYYVTENYNSDIGTRVVSFTAEELAAKQYYGYIVNYDEYTEPNIATDIVTLSDNVVISTDVPIEEVITPDERILNGNDLGVDSMDSR